MQTINAAIAIVIRDARVLICQRREGDFLGGYWEFPGGKCEDGESLEDCLHRELREEVDIRVQPHLALAPIEHQYPHQRVRLHPFICRHVAGEPKLIECQAAKWVEPDALVEHEFPPANEDLIRQIIAYLSAGQTGGP